MRVMIAGGTGLIGRLLVKRMLESGHSVCVLSRNPQKGIFQQPVEVVKWDGRSAAGWQPLVEEADAIVNLTGENLGAKRWTAERMKLLRSSRIDPARAILEGIQMASHRPGVLIQASAVGYYGNTKDQVVDETFPAGRDSLSQLVVEWEDVSKPIEELGVRRIIIRQGIVLDDRAGALPRMFMPFRYYLGGPVGGGKQWISWISRRDVAGAILFLLNLDGASGIYNLSAPQSMTNAEFGKTIASVSRRPYWMPAPAFLLKLLFGEMARVVLEGQRVSPLRLLAAGYRFEYPHLQPALEEVFSR